MELPICYCSQKSSSELRVFWEYLEELNDAVLLLQRRQSQQTEQWDIVSAEQKQHCSDLASIYQQLQQLFLASGCGYINNNDKSRESCSKTNNVRPGEEKSHGENVHEDSFRREICDLMQNFRNHIEQHVEKTNKRFDDMQKYIDSVYKTTEDNHRRFAQQEERLLRLEERQEQLQQLLVNAPTMEDVNKLQEVMTQQLLSLTEKSSLALQRHGAEVDEAFAKQEAQRQKEQKDLHHEATVSIKRAAQQLAEDLVLLRNELQAQITAAGGRISALEERTARNIEEERRARAEQTRQQIHRVQFEFGERHSRLVEDTAEAIANITQITDGLPEKVSLLQKEVGSIHHTLQRHGEVLGKHCLQGSLRGAFDEVKDWLLDLERRTLSRGEFDEVISKMESKVAALRQDLMSFFSGHTKNKDI